MVEPTPITDAGLAALERSIVSGEATAHHGMPISYAVLHSLLARLRTSEARVKELEEALTKARQDIANAHPNMIPTLDPNDPDTPYERGVAVDVLEQKS